jgi:hypothetical protein
MKWFDKWFAKKVKQAWDDSRNELAQESTYANDIGLVRPSSKRNSLLRNDADLHSRGTNFMLYSANGGTVVEIRDYDPINDRNHNILYIIPKEADLGQQLGHIVTMEALKR